MCGIHASISRRAFREPSENLKALLKNRGPDHIGQVQASVGAETGETTFITLTSTVLSLRGGHTTAQPFVDRQTQSALCWNGEAWKIGANRVDGNDGQAVFDLLLRASSPTVHSSESASAILHILRSISGPCAFVFLDRNHGQIYFGRDRLGRRSLLYKIDSGQDTIEFSSMADLVDDPWQEVEADGIYQMSYEDRSCPEDDPGQLNALLSGSNFQIYRHEWEALSQDASGISLGIFNTSIAEQYCMLNAHSSSVAVLRHQLETSLNYRLLNIPRPPSAELASVRLAVLFSGGLDCSVLARMAHDIMPQDQEIDLLNVAFENPRVVRAALNKLKNIKQNGKSRRKAEEALPDQPETPEDAPNSSPYENCPDRETGRKAFQELQTVCPSRIWRFIAVDVPYKETLAHKSKVISLIHPHNTEMDLSIAYALYFASRGKGLATTLLNPTPESYTTPARVLLSGLGADELFGGYIRHATAFNRNGFSALIDELKLDVDRLGKRNLGRDDRIISNWGKEVRFPYLDEDLVKWAVESPIWEKCGFGEKKVASEDEKEPEIEPGKKVLRLLALELGMQSVAIEKKRAIQFGARTAKMELGNTKGTTLIS